MKLLPLAVATCAAFGLFTEWTEAAAVLRASRPAKARFQEPEAEEERKPKFGQCLMEALKYPEP